MISPSRHVAGPRLAPLAQPAADRAQGRAPSGRRPPRGRRGRGGGGGLQPRRPTTRRGHRRLDALPAVAAAAGGRLEVLMDGGIRRGTDVLVALALGARAVLSGARRALGAGGGRGGGRAPGARDPPLRDPERVTVAGLRVAGRGRPRPHRAPVGRLPCRHEGGRRRPGRCSRGARRRRCAAACRRGRLRHSGHDAALDRLCGSRRTDRPEAGDDSRRLLRHGRSVRCAPQAPRRSCSTST